MYNKQVYLYAEYKINNIIKRQLIPSNILSDLVYENGMTSVTIKKCIKVDDKYIDCTSTSETYSIGVPITAEEYIEMYEKSDPRINKNEGTYQSLKEMGNRHKYIIFPNKEIGFQYYSQTINPKNDKELILIDDNSLIKGKNYWYIKLIEDNQVRYERTILGDKKYRGQNCDSYSFALVCEYEMNNEKKRVILLEESKTYLPSNYNNSKVDSIIDKAKNLVSKEYKFEGFSGVSPLYKYNTEDSASVFNRHNDKIMGQNVITITGSGDAILDLFMNGAEKIISFDSNELTQYWAELKFIAAKYLSYDDFLKLINIFDQELYNNISQYLTKNTKKFWDEIILFSNTINTDLNSDSSLLFYKSSIFSSNCTYKNPVGYCNKDNYYRMQESLKNKSIDDIQFITCDIYDLPNKVDLRNYSYAYFSNVLDFICGVDKYVINQDKLEEFKQFIQTQIIPSMKENSNIDLCYLCSSWHMGLDGSLYESIYKRDDGFIREDLYNKDYILSYQSELKKKKTVK